MYGYISPIHHQNVNVHDLITQNQYKYPKTVEMTSNIARKFWLQLRFHLLRMDLVLESPQPKNCGTEKCETMTMHILLNANKNMQQLASNK